jgi:hypothetical protein
MMIGQTPRNLLGQKLARSLEKPRMRETGNKIRATRQKLLLRNQRGVSGGGCRQTCYEKDREEEHHFR